MQNKLSTCIFITCLIILHNLISSCDNQNNIEKNIPINNENPRKLYYDSGELLCTTEIKYEKNIKYEVVECYHKNGALHKQYQYKNGKKDGELKVYSTSGELSLVAYYKDGKKEGSIINYHFSNIPSRIANYKNDKQHGLTTYYHWNGTTEMDMLFDNGTLINAKCTNGRIFNQFEIENYNQKKPNSMLNCTSETQFKKNKKDGLYQKYHINGYQWIEERYKNNKKHGLSQIYDKKGKLELEMLFDNGILISAKCSNGYEFNKAEIENYNNNITELKCKTNKTRTYFRK